MLKKYAELVVKTGVNLQSNQYMVISSPIECAEFARLVAEEAFKAGARDVYMNWRDELFTKIRYERGMEDIFSEFPEWRKEFFLQTARQGAAFVSIAASDPELLREIKPERIMTEQKTRSIALKEYMDRIMSNKNAWCVVSVPTAAWALKVFPHLDVKTAISELQMAILRTVRVDASDPVAAWEEHKKNLKAKKDFLNAANLRYLKYSNSIGTDLKVELPPEHLWVSGADVTEDGVEFIANMPTEEVYTLPKKDGVNGKVVSSKPLNYNGNLIEQFTLTFANGRVIDFSAKKGEELLAKMLETDEGASYLGEVALVAHDSPISNSNILFYETLFDENASCHFALGKAYPTCLNNGEKMSKEELSAHGINDSLIHEDFMIGTADLEIIGVKADGSEIRIFSNGNFAF